MPTKLAMPLFLADDQATNGSLAISTIKFLQDLKFFVGSIIASFLSSFQI